ncbi:hypothetical protein ACFV3E_05905 [Streptomyces sp. NPDC059718]
MEAETLAGLIGFGGAVVGAGGALLGAWLQQHHQAKAEKAARIEERARAAGDKALSELYALRRHVMECNSEEIPESRQPWLKIAEHHMDAAEMAVGLMPQAEQVREQVKETFLLASTAASYAVMLNESPAAQCAPLRWAASEGITVLSAYMRGDPIPPPSRRVENLRKMVRDYHARHHRQAASEPS